MRGLLHTRAGKESSACAFALGFANRETRRSKRGIAVAGIAAVMLAWLLPPNGSLTVTGLDKRLALFVLGTVVGIIVVEGNQ